jgi:release factor glutamine methyltransferase
VRMVEEDKYNIVVFPGVYPPSEDTYLLLDALEIRQDDVFLEVGSGAGLVSLAASKKALTVVSIDSSFDAVRNTSENLTKSNLSKNSHVIESDLLGAFAPSAKFSLIVFNPPYLPQDNERTELDYALVGGKQGSELTRKFVRQAVEHLVSGGRILVVASTLADIDSIRETMVDCGFSVEVVSEAAFFFEKIQVLRGSIKQDHKETVL